MSRVLVCLVALLLPSSMLAQDVSVVGGLTQGVIPSSPFGGTAPRDVRPATGRSTIRGRILTADTGQPMRRATVRITAPALRVPRMALTGPDGRYEFRDLPAGRYSINASRTTFVSWSYGQTQPASPGKPFILADGQTADGVDVALPRGGVITGRVTDELGELVPNANVMVLRQQFQRGQRRLVQTGGFVATTNDIGEYRVFGLAPGQYFVAARLQQGPAGLGILTPGTMGGGAGVEGREAQSGYAMTFYPGTADVSTAQRVSVGLAQTVSEINFSLLAARLVSVSGYATDLQGRPLSGGFVNILPRGGIMGIGGGGGGSIGPDGSFTLSNVAPGEYILRANGTQPPSGRGAERIMPEFSVATVSVNGEDVTGVRLIPVVPVTVAGRLLFDDPAAAQTLKPSNFRPLVQQFDPDANQFIVDRPSPTPTRDDFTFEVRTIPGRISLNIPPTLTAGMKAAWRIRSVRVDGRDVTDSGFEVGAQGVTGVEIELTMQQQTVTGIVTDARGAAVKDYLVVISAQDPSRRTTALNRYFATARAGDDGSFRAMNLPAGQYFAIALDGADPMELQNPDVLEGLSRQAFAFTVGPGETRTLDLKLFTLR